MNALALLFKSNRYYYRQRPGGNCYSRDKEEIRNSNSKIYLLQKYYASFMIFCLVYENAQNHLQATAECPVMTNNIIWNAVFLVQCLWLIKNRDRFSPKDAQLDEENV